MTKTDYAYHCRFPLICNFLVTISTDHTNLFTAVIVGGIDMMSQALMLAKKPHIIIGL